MKKIALLLTLFALPLAAQQKTVAAPITHPALRVAFAQTTTGNAATVTWVASTTPGGTVSLYRCVGTPCTATSSFTLLVAGLTPAGPYVDATITAGIYSYYGVTVLNGATSAPSNIATGTLSPQPPTGLSVAVN